MSWLCLILRIRRYGLLFSWRVCLLLQDLYKAVRGGDGGQFVEESFSQVLAEIPLAPYLSIMIPKSFFFQKFLTVTLKRTNLQMGGNTGGLGKKGELSREKKPLQLRYVSSRGLPRRARAHRGCSATQRQLRMSPRRAGCGLNKR